MHPSPKSRRRMRRFSESVKREAVSQFESGQYTVLELASLLHAGKSTIYKWIDTYSTLQPRGMQIVEKVDSSCSQLSKLREELSQAHALIARQAIELDFNKHLEAQLLEQHGIDLKKSATASPRSKPSRPSSGSSSTAESRNDTPSH